MHFRPFIGLIDTSAKGNRSRPSDEDDVEGGFEGGGKTIHHGIGTAGDFEKTQSRLWVSTRSMTNTIFKSNNGP